MSSGLYELCEVSLGLEQLAASALLGTSHVTDAKKQRMQQEVSKESCRLRHMKFDCKAVIYQSRHVHYNISKHICSTYPSP